MTRAQPHDRDLEDAAVVVTVLAAMAAAAGGSRSAAPAKAFWGDPAFDIGAGAPGPHGWWASGLPR